MVKLLMLDDQNSGDWIAIVDFLMIFDDQNSGDWTVR